MTFVRLRDSFLFVQVLVLVGVLRFLYEDGFFSFKCRVLGYGDDVYTRLGYNKVSERINSGAIQVGW